MHALRKNRQVHYMRKSFKIVLLHVTGPRRKLKGTHIYRVLWENLDAIGVQEHILTYYFRKFSDSKRNLVFNFLLKS